MFLIHYTWCLPQTLIALAVRLCVRVHSKEKYNNTTVYYTYMKRASVSLGHKIFLCQRDWHNSRIIKHEYGHYKQSLMLGWPYLLVVAIPSMLWNVLGYPRALKKDITISYYDYWCEKWADKLGGVKREGNA